MSDYTLKPCPFCGGQADIEDISNNEYVRCEIMATYYVG